MCLVGYPGMPGMPGSYLDDLICWIEYTMTNVIYVSYNTRTNRPSWITWITRTRWQMWLQSTALKLSGCSFQLLSQTKWPKSTGLMNGQRFICNCIQKQSSLSADVSFFSNSQHYCFKRFQNIDSWINLYLHKIE